MVFGLTNLDITEHNKRPAALALCPFNLASYFPQGTGAPEKPTNKEKFYLSSIITTDIQKDSTIETEAFNIASDNQFHWIILVLVHLCTRLHCTYL